jgi:regulatory protein
LASRTHFRPEGRSLVKKELRKKGIKREIIDQLLQEERGSATEEMLAEKYARKKMERLKSLPVLVAKRRLFSALLMRGFDNEIAKTVVDKLLERE